MKKCTKCGIEKPLSEFHKNKAYKDGLRNQCKSCAAKYRACYYQENKERISEQNARYHQENKEIISERKSRYYQEILSKEPACVYQIINNKNGKIYIGETLTAKLRWKDHLSRLRGGYHVNSKLQEDFNKFGEEAFGWEILREFPKDKETLLLEEARTINRFLKEDRDLYNLTLTIEQLKLLQENGE